MEKMLEVYGQDLLYVFDNKVVVIKNNVEIKEVDGYSIKHYSDDWESLVNLKLPPKIRKPHKLLSLERSWRLIQRVRYGMLGIKDEEYPYVIGMNHTVVGHKIYFHSGAVGHKHIGVNQKVTYNFTEDLGLNDRIGTHNFRSVLVYGTLRIVEDPKIKREVLLTMLDHLNVNHEWNEKMPSTTTVFEVEIDYMIGKEHHHL